MSICLMYYNANRKFVLLDPKMLFSINHLEAHIFEKF